MALNGRKGEIHSNKNMDYNSDVKLRNCFVCKTLCNNTCNTCGEFYCSKKCQRDDWQSHRYVCFPMPDLIMGPTPPNNQQYNRATDQNRKEIQSEYKKNANSTSRSSTPSSIQSQTKIISFGQAPNNNDDVILICTKSSNTFYIRTCSNNDQYITDSKDFNHYGRHSRRIHQMPSKNDIVLVTHKGSFFRAVVIKPVAEDKIEVALCDIGFTLTKSLLQMRQISDELCDRKRFNFKITLEHLPNGVGKPEWEKLQDFVKKETVFNLKFEGDDWASGKYFKLLEKSNGKPIEELLLQNQVENGGEKQISMLAAQKIEESFTSLEIDANEKPMEKSECTEVVNIVLNDITNEPLPEVADIVVIDNSTIYVGLVSVVLKENLKKFAELHCKVQTFGNNLQDEYEPEPEEMCLAKFEGDWYRARFSSSYYVLIDYGSSELIDKKDIRKYPIELKDPCYTNLCHIQNFTSEPVQKIKAKLETLLEEYSVHENCICASGDNDPNEYDVTFPKILELVRDE